MTHVVSPSEQRTAVAVVARLIERHYVFAQDARTYEDALRAGVRLDDTVPAADFCRAATEALRSIDRHFAVTWGTSETVLRVTTTPDDGPAITADVVGSVGVLAVRVFDDADAPAAREVARAAAQELEGCASVIVDLRANPGGWPSMVEYLLAPFLGAHPVHVVTFRSTRAPARMAWTRPDPDLPDLSRVRVIVVVDQHTASAAESFAYALQTTGRATVVGERTAGAANPVELFTDPTGPAVYIPTGAPIDPRSGTNWDHVGVRPDVGAPSGDALAVARDLSTVAAPPSG
ncbi:peptidase S41-like protein [Mumia flava]|uniref:Peptidase S41-like protein n=1 Tax=Mumia flava TaxID=1348852 RepID=A0A0B2BQP4_9ACTN|nr:S41 family peptidase [Mumia flava]PJJ54208.1 peptidase S41-like protein [Mumia flava]